MKYRCCMFFVLLGVVSLLTACEASPVVEPAITSAYQKPGARVALQNPSEIVVDSVGDHTMLIALTSAHNEGVMTVRVSASDGLTLMSDDHYRFDKAIDLDYRIPVNIRAISQGRHYLYFQVDVYDGGKTYTRQLGLAVQVGESQRVLQKSTTQGSLNILPSEERVGPATAP